MAFLAIFALELGGLGDMGPYTGIISYLVLPSLFVIGLLIIPVGLWRLRKKERAGKPMAFPVFDLNNPRLRTIGLAIGFITVLNLMVVSTATFKGLDVLHSDQFCGGTCHSVMEPEAVAHRVTTHAGVYCADCHVGEGAGHWTVSKLRGVRQMFQFVTGDIKRPAPQPTEVETVNCVRCHATQRFTEDRLHIKRVFNDDEKTASKTTVWRMIIGGYRDGKWSGVHRHNGMKVRYLSDPERLTITEVEVTRPEGTTDKYVAKDVKTPANAKWFEMSCTDCHNRPAHGFSSPEKVVDDALARGAIDPELPFIRREALAALKGQYPSRAEAEKAIPAALEAFYAKQATPLSAEAKEKVAAAGKLLGTQWGYNNFPQMKIGWDTYKSFLQHEPGCYRCHDKNHFNAEQKELTKKCSGVCHEVIADEEEAPEVIDVLYP